MTIIISFNRASGLFVTEFLDQFQESATATTIAFGAAPIMFSICNILLPSVLLPRFCTRTLAFAGGIFAGISVTCMSFARSMSIMTLLFGIMGFAHGFIFAPQTVLLGFYFQKRLAFANAFAFMGMAAASIVSPIVAKFLLEIYGLQGTLLLYGAFTFNIVPVALLFRPVTAYTVVSSAELNKEEDACNAHDEHSVSLLTQEEYKLHNDLCDDTSTLPSRHNKDCQINYERPMVKSHSHCVPADSERNCIESDLKSHYVLNRENMCQQRSSSQTNNDISFQKNYAPTFDSIDHSYPHDNGIESTEHEIETILGSQSKYTCEDKIKLEVEHNKESRENYIELEALQDDRLPQVTKATSASKAKDCDEVSNTSSGTHSESSLWHRFVMQMRASVYSNPLAILLLLAAGLSVHTQPMSTYLPALGEENGLSSSQVPYLLTVTGITNLVGKLAIGYIADLKLCDRLYIVLATNMIFGGVMQFTRFCQSFSIMMTLSVALGILCGVIDFMFIVLVSDKLGKEHIGHMMPGFLLVNGVVMSTDHVIVGALKDASGYFYVSFNYMGALVLLGELLFAIVLFVSNLKGKKANGI
ncbi:monocarboxylate transporter 12 [Plakobranchus ocellatus]|uniref:Monocarboxylate transporter 12 n=1 Tax=Plakobranchus ocellatus TaxID=259542 RepID=A0AAV3X891_9GAST|nr:monocarboxylate transporter 12 [Plakobranchus ocellatus]